MDGGRRQMFRRGIEGGKKKQGRQETDRDGNSNDEPEDLFYKIK